MKDWVGFDFDGTLCRDDQPSSNGALGDPIKPMIDKAIEHIKKGDQVYIFTARIWPLGTLDEGKNKSVTNKARAELAKIRVFCRKNFGQVLPITCVKLPAMQLLYDDNAIRVERNTGKCLHT
jgi:hypothetical protein